MNMDSSSGKSSLSGREFGKVREDILRKTIRMKEKIGNRYNLMSQESNMDNVKSIQTSDWKAKSTLCEPEVNEV